MSNSNRFYPSSLYNRRQNYLRYLDSTQWQSKKRDYWLSQRPHCCWVCDKPWTLNAKGFNFHHASYQNLFDEPLDDLVLLCREHHEAIEEAWKDWKDSGMDLRAITYLEICNLRIASNRSLRTVRPFFGEVIN
jgi:hypothetical protein